jgi:putative transcriptional regulator
MQEYHYTESGLDTVWLSNGFRLVGSDRGESLVIEDIEGLHAAIGRSVVEEEKKLTGPEIRFLRTELFLSQNALSRLLGVTEQTVARWEKGKVVIPTTSDAALRQLYLEHVGGAGKITELLQRIADIEHGVFVRFTMERRRLSPEQSEGERERKHWDLLEAA